MEQIATNIDILKTIFNYLKLNEQINASQVCPEFQYIMVNCLWRYKYRHIKVYKLNGNIFIINTKYKTQYAKCELGKEHFEHLEQNEFHKFLQLNQENITELELCDYRSGKLRENTDEFSINNKWKFAQLKKLILEFVVLAAKDLQQIYRNCKQLEVLRIKQCRNLKADSITLKIHDSCDYDKLLRVVKMVKEFQIEYREMQFSDSTLNLHDLLSHNNLKHLNLNMPLKNLLYKETPRLRVNCCEILEIGNFDEYKTLQKFNRLYLKTFENLSNLTLQGSLNKILIDTQFIQNLSDSCVILKYLNFKRCIINVDDFGLFTSITDITLDNCMSLTWRNLKQLLALPQLEAFHTNYSNYTREIENFFIPFNLKCLTLVGNEFRFAQIFDNPTEQLTNLKQLIYCDGEDTKVFRISLKFPNLEMLQILPHHIDVQDLLQLANLKTFKVPKLVKNQTKLLHLMHLLKHPRLNELSLTAGGINLFNEMSIDLSYIIKTSLSYLLIDFDLFNYLFEFLLDLLQFNSKLQLIVTSDEVAEIQYYFNLVKNRKFCRDSIKLCGFQIDCQDFTDCPKIVEQKLKLIKELSEFKNVNIII